MPKHVAAYSAILSPSCTGPIRPRTIVYEAPDKVELERARDYRIKELKMYDILRELVFYSCFVWVILAVSYDFRDPKSFSVKDNMVQTFIGQGSVVGGSVAFSLPQVNGRKRR